MTSVTLTLMTPRKPWSVWIVSLSYCIQRKEADLSLELSLIKDLNRNDRWILDSTNQLANAKPPSIWRTYQSSYDRQLVHKCMSCKAYSFQYGFNVRLMTEVVWICSPSTETIANGSGTRRISRLISESAATTGSDSRIRMKWGRVGCKKKEVRD